MKSVIKVDTETYTTSEGGITAKIWVSECNTDDSNIFVLQENYNMLNEPIVPLFSTIATPAHISEYPINHPEEKGGLYRTDHMYLMFKRVSDYFAFIKDINRRIAKLCNNIDYLKQEKNYITEEWTFEGFTAQLKYTNSRSYSNCLTIELPVDKAYFICGKEAGNDRFFDVCTPEDLLVFNESDTECKYRTHKISICAPYAVIHICKDKIKELLLQLTNH